MTAPKQRSPWLALTALVVGFFMIVLDMTIVAVANPAILDHFNADVNQVIWVTSAYLLAFAVPLLVTGRLGDKYGPKNLYLLGMTVFSTASLACCLSTTISMLIGARAIQGFGAALMTPQTMAVITRIFPKAQRSAAMAVWGAVAGLGNLALRISECVDAAGELTGVQQGTQDVVVEVAETLSDTTKMLQTPVDGFDRPVGNTDVEVRQDLLVPVPQGPPELRELLQTGRQSLLDFMSDDFFLGRYKHLAISERVLRLLVMKDAYAIKSSTELQPDGQPFPFSL
ncbi:hypothetical protein ACH46_20645 [Gordonia phthalatica]|uniref:Major facilitator superfamily (MFS) profile domain-containing protein n=1 Tax=Gordonia phthalatica TaxID=1136941 RepID=A0A0N9NKB9_9ACTN|nr:hypothetical protein ACH46_20645 [Gordonia phthalatica]